MSSQASEPIRRPRPATVGTLGNHLAGRVDPLTSAVLVFPLLLVYQLGILLSRGRNGVDYLTGEEFTGLEGITEYLGGGDVREINGIRAQAEPQGFSNRWLLDLTLKPFHPSSSSIWKPEAYADQVTPFLDRCHVDANGVTAREALDVSGGYGHGRLQWWPARKSMRSASSGPQVPAS